MTHCLASVLLSFVAAAADPPAADLVLLGGKIVTVDAKLPVVEALAVRGDRIVAVGSSDQIREHVGQQTDVLDLEGRLAVPGFIEGHGHFTGLGRSRMTLNLADARSWDEVVQRVGRAALVAPPGRWIHGRGWHQGKWAHPPNTNVDGYPTHESLSQVTPNNPVWLVHGTGHMSFANDQAMQLARVTRETKDPPGGEIVRDSQGNPVGVFRETAQGLFARALATDRAQLTERQRAEQALREIELATEECLAKGITSFQDAGSSFATIDRFKELASEGKLDVRLWVMIRESNRRLAEKLPQYRMIDIAGRHLTVRAIKQMVDGALGTHGAWLLEPYADLPASRGLNTASLEEIAATARLAERHGFQLCVHAIGDRANREILNLMAGVAARNPRFSELRWRIEHAQHIEEADIPRFARLGVIASMQANHCTSDGPFVIDRLGYQRARRGAYPWRRLLDAGAIVTNGTDAPVEDVNPIGSFHAAVTRRMKSGRQFFPEQRMTRAQALRSYTLDAAYAAFEEDVKGSLSVGKLADVVVLSKDIMTVAEDQIMETEVVYTIVGGRVLFRSEEKHESMR